MKKIILFITILMCSILFTACGGKILKDEHGCLMDYDQTISYASRSHKPILVFFTSEGDDDYSTKLVHYVMKDSAYKKEIASKYTVLHVDFSQEAFQKTVAPDNATPQQQEQANTYTNIMQNNYQLAVLFNISQMPGIFLCTPQGYVVSRLDENNDITDLNELTNALNSNKEELKRFNSFVKATEKGSSIKKVEAVDALYNATKSEYRSFLIALIKYALSLDKENESGLTGKFVFAQAEIEAMLSYSQGDVEAAVKKYLEAADNQYVKAEQKQECLYKAAYLVAYSESVDYDGIISYLQTAYDIAPESSRAPAIKEAIEYFEARINASSND